MGNKIFSRKKNVDPDAAWKKQNDEIAKNPMYKLVGFGGTGLLVDEFNEHGAEKMKQLAREKLKEYLYNGGDGGTISKEEYLKWYKDKMELEMGLEEIEKVHFSDKSFNTLSEHKACWRLDKRGGVGETPFHLAHLGDIPEVASILLKLFPKMALDVYEGDEYFGESALHIAIVFNRFDAVKELISHKADINQRATGRFFLPEDQKKGKTNNTNYEGDAYYGEYPLAFAASFNNQEIYDYLIENGANPDLQDSFGNTVLHLTVIHNQPQMYKHAVQHNRKLAHTNIKNNMGLTPITLATKLGRHVIFKEMLELNSTEFWSYSNVYCSAYPLTTLDSIGPDGKTNWSSSLMIIVNGETDEHLEMLEGGVMRQLLDEKWKTFARRRFIVRLVIAMIHLSLISIAIYTRPLGRDLLHYSGVDDAMRYIAEILVCFGCGLALFLEVLDIRSRDIKSFAKNYINAPAQMVYMMSCVLILMCIPFRFLHLHIVEDILLIFAVPGSWFFLLFFARGVKLTGPFVTMVYKMLEGDLVRFGVIYIIFLLGFAQGFYFLFQDGDDDNSDTQKFATPQDTVMTLFQMTLGEFKYDSFNFARYPPLTKLIFAIFMILVPILLLNMLIAMMGNTYQRVISKSEKEWRKQWAKTVVVLERGFSKEKLLRFQREYSVNITKPEGEVRALVVIKTESKTKAQSRKAADANWKRLGKEVIWQLKDNKRSGKTGMFELQLQRASKKKKLSPRQLEVCDNEVIPDAFTSTVAQLAWQKDIDLTKGHAFIEDPAKIDEISPRIDLPLGTSSSLKGAAAVPNGKVKQKETSVSSSETVMTPNARMSLLYNRVHPMQPFVPELDSSDNFWR
ncbi:transient receptor potential cation channel subfamily V member 5-like [Gigantopelta aegis]|uniref:transient receptor potential cation channel subfamily V member 5-like n=1 Tax=Gigantopelta aegis TaxID=1735272 RepID=UPI001B888FE5|nr:transient receptor potential cation channel subfamily V member 5-like [Gigantopelta aegis]